MESLTPTFSPPVQNVCFITPQFLYAFYNAFSGQVSCLDLNLPFVFSFLTCFPSCILYPAAFVPCVLPDCIQHLLHVATHSYLRHFRAALEFRRLADSATSVQVSNVASCWAFSRATLDVSDIGLSTPLRRDVAKNFRLSWPEFIYWIASGRTMLPVQTYKSYTSQNSCAPRDASNS